MPGGQVVSVSSGVRGFFPFPLFFLLFFPFPFRVRPVQIVPPFLPFSPKYFLPSGGSGIPDFV